MMERLKAYAHRFMVAFSSSAGWASAIFIALWLWVEYLKPMVTK